MMQSFDFYDTLVVRLVADPADIFSLVGERLEIVDFRSMRQAAETDARRALGGEVTFDQVYEHLRLAEDVKEKAKALELDLELTLLAPVAAVLARVQSGDLIVSDMYHHERLYRDVLGRFISGFVPGAVLVSGYAGVNKYGGGLWKIVAANYPTLRTHTGDNPESDVRQARRHGLVAHHFAGATLNRYEARMAKEGNGGSFLAGASRAARLSLVRSDSSLEDTATIEAFASVFSPLLLAFAYWILRSCAEQKIKDIYFLARDGQIPWRMCSRLVAESGQDLRCHYLYASRHALHLPGCKTIEDAETWLLDDTPRLTLRILAERASISAEIAAAAASPHFTLGVDEDIPLPGRKLLGKVIREPVFVEAFMRSVERAYQPAVAYYRSQGFTEGGNAAVVDVGWNGRVQRSLENLLDKAGLRPGRMLGLYLCLSRRVNGRPGDDLRGFVVDPERPAQAAFFDGYRHIFEAALSADHPTTVGFEVTDGAAGPLFGAPYPPRTEQKIALQHATYDRFLAYMMRLNRAAGRAVPPPAAAAMENLRQFLYKPTLQDGTAFVGFSFVDGQAGAVSKPMCQRVTLSELIRHRGDYGFWPEGTLSASGLGALALLRRAVRGVRARIRTALR